MSNSDYRGSSDERIIENRKRNRKLRINVIYSAAQLDQLDPRNFNAYLIAKFREGEREAKALRYDISYNTKRESSFSLLRESPKSRALRLADKLNEQANRKSRFAESAIRCTSTTFLASIKQRIRRKTGLPRDLLYMQIRDGYGGNRGM